MYDVMDTRSNKVDKKLEQFIETKIWGHTDDEQHDGEDDNNQGEEDDDSSQQKQKTEEELARQFMKVTTQFDLTDLRTAYEKTLAQMLVEFSKQTLTMILTTFSLEQLIPIVLKERQLRTDMMHFLKSVYSSAHITWESTGNKASLKKV